MQENAYITAVVEGKVEVGFYTHHEAAGACIYIPQRGTFKVDPDTIRYLGEPRDA